MRIGEILDSLGNLRAIFPVELGNEENFRVLPNTWQGTRESGSWLREHLDRGVNVSFGSKKSREIDEKRLVPKGHFR